MNEEEFEEWDYVLHQKGRRARRRELDAALEPGHLRAWYDKQGWPRPDTSTFRQLQRAYRHSCHAGCCAWASYVKRADRRQDRHQVRMSLLKGYRAHRRKVGWMSEAGYKGT